MTPSRLLAVLLVLGLAPRLHAEFLSVVEITDLRGNSTFQICTAEEKKKIDAELKAETKAFPKAIEDAKTEWKIINKDTPFPSGRIKPRTLKVKASTPNADEAAKLLANAEKREDRSIENQKEEEEKILKMKAPRRRRGQRGGDNSRLIAQQKAEVKEDRAKDETADKAEVILRPKLAAASGHAIPFYGPNDALAQKEAPKKKADAKKK